MDQYRRVPSELARMYKKCTPQKQKQIREELQKLKDKLHQNGMVSAESLHESLKR